MRVTGSLERHGQSIILGPTDGAKHRPIAADALVESSCVRLLRVTGSGHTTMNRSGRKLRLLFSHVRENRSDERSIFLWEAVDLRYFFDDFDLLEFGKRLIHL